MNFDKLQKSLIDAGFSLQNLTGLSAIKHKNLLEEIVKHTPFLPQTTKPFVRIKLILEGISSPPLCYCGKPRNWFKKSFLTYCSISCSSSSPEVRKKMRETTIKNHGVNHSETFRNKAIATSIERYGSLENAKLKRMDTMTKNNQEKYGVDHIFQLQSVKDNISKKWLEKYGGHPLLDERVLEKQKKTNLDRYGVPCTLNIRDARDNQKVVMSSREVQDNIKNTRESKYGGHHLALPEYDLKKRQTNLERYGVEHVAQSHLTKENIRVYHDDELFRELFEKQGIDGLMSLGYSKDRMISRAYRLGLLIPQKSSGELQIGGFLNNLGVQWESDRTEIAPYELDFLIRDRNLAIEYCGIYWHSDQFKTPDYHYKKMKLCQQKNIRLITIFENEWLNRRTQVESVLTSILNFNETLPARKMKVSEIGKDIARDFMDQKHIQGSPTMFTKVYGLSMNDRIYAVMAFTKRSEGIWELVRFCSHNNIVGGASKLLKYFCNNEDWENIISFADLRYSQGNLYHKLGFSLDKIIRHDYGYVLGSSVDHKFNHRKKFYANKYNISSMTEREIMEAEGIHRIYDCGKLRFVLKRNKSI